MSEGIQNFSQGAKQGYTIAELDTRYTLLTTAGTPMASAAAALGLAAVQTWADAAPTSPDLKISGPAASAEQARQYFQDMQQSVLNRAHI